jgi:hypothetical protein
MYSVSWGVRKVRKWEKGEKTHAKTEAGDERKGATTPDGNHRDVEGPVFGADLCGHCLFQQVSSASPKTKRADWDETFEDGTRAASRHVPCIAAAEVGVEMRKRTRLAKGSIYPVK